MYGTMKRPSTTEIGAVRPGVWPATTARPQQIFRPDRRRGAAPGCRTKTLPGGVQVTPGLPLKTTMTTREHGKLDGLWWLSVAFGGLRPTRAFPATPFRVVRIFRGSSSALLQVRGSGAKIQFLVTFGHEKSRLVIFTPCTPPFGVVSHVSRAPNFGGPPTSPDSKAHLT
jgi:hypothetical protein